MANMSLMAITKQNNETVAFLRNGEYYKAVEASMAALKCYRSRPGYSSRSSSSCYYCSQEHPHHQQQHQHHHHPECESILDQCMLLSEIDAGSKTQNIGGFIYQHGIMLLHGIEEADPNSTTAILVFNAALANHMHAIYQQQEDPRKGLQKARRLYELAYSADDVDNNILFQFAVINNLMMIDRALGNMAFSNACFGYLLSIFMLFVDQGCDMHLLHVRCFLSNLPHTASTAIAA